MLICCHLFHERIDWQNKTLAVYNYFCFQNFEIDFHVRKRMKRNPTRERHGLGSASPSRASMCNKTVPYVRSPAFPYKTFAGVFNARGQHERASTWSIYSRTYIMSTPARTSRVNFRQSANAHYHSTKKRGKHDADKTKTPSLILFTPL